MAEFHISSKIVSRGEGRSAVASAAYRCACELKDERTGVTHSYVSKPGVIHAEIMLPAGALDELADRSRLWNAAEAAERRKDSRVARELEFALPIELSVADAIALARAYVQEALVERHAVAVDIAIHKPNEQNVHCHALYTTREATATGLGRKVTALDRKDELLFQRELLAVRANFALAHCGIEARVDHRSYEARGIRLEPQTKIGPGARRYGQAAERTQQHRDLAWRNGEAIAKDPTIVLDALTEHTSTFTHAEIAKLVSRHTADDAQFQRVYAKVRAHPDLVRLGHDHDGNERFSTKEMVAVEKAMAEQADGLAARGKHGLSWGVHSRVLTHASLGEEQRSAFEHVTGKHDLALVAGYAGTGKSRMLAAAREAWEASGYRVRGAAIAGIAAEALENSSGIKSRTIASLEYAWAKGEERLTKRDILVIDEAGMVGSRQMERLLREVHEAGAAVRLIGDANQLQPIAAGSAFKALAERHSAAYLGAVRRQRSPWMREATVELATKQTAKAIDRYQSAGMVHEFATREDARAKLIAMWNHDRREKPDRTSIILTHTRAEVVKLNKLARDAMRAAGDLGKEEVAVATEHGERRFSAGDRVLFLENSRNLDVKNGSIGTLVETAPYRMVVQLDSGTKKAAGRIVVFNPADYSHLDHAYASTIHKLQGTTVRDAYLMATPGLDRNISYVALTRHTRRVETVYAKEDFREGYADFSRRLGRDGTKDTTLDRLERSRKMVKMAVENVERAESEFQRRLRSVRAQGEMQAQKESTARETDFQKRLAEVRAQRMAESRSMTQKL